MIVHVPAPLRSCTGGRAQVDAEGVNLAALLLDLDRRYPGIRFGIIDEQDRIREEIKLFVDQEQVYALATALAPGAEVHVRHHWGWNVGKHERKREPAHPQVPPAADTQARTGRAPVVTVHVPTALRSYTSRRAQVDAEGMNLAALLLDLDRRYPGIRFRIIDEQDCIRRHIKLFVDQAQVHGLEVALAPGAEVHIMCALSGG